MADRLHFVAEIVVIDPVDSDLDEGEHVEDEGGWLAANWFLATTEMKNPRQSNAIRNRAELTSSARTVPRKGT